MAVLIDKMSSASKKATQTIPAIPKDYTPHPTAMTWTRRADAEALFEMPFMDLLLKAQAIHRETFSPNEVQMSQLLSIKTGGCAEDCGYCNQSSHFDTGLKAEKLIEKDVVSGRS